MNELTAMQSEVLESIRRNTLTRGYPPTVREIGDALGLASPSTVHAHLAALERKGYIERDRMKPRALVITDLADEDSAEEATNLARYWAGMLAHQGRDAAAADLYEVADELDRLRSGVTPVDDVEVVE